MCKFHHPKALARIAFIEGNADTLDMFEQGRVVDARSQGQVDHPGQQQLIDLVFHCQQLRKGQSLSFHRQVDIRSRAIGSLGAGLMVRRRRRRHDVAVERERLSLPSAPNQVWSMDFVFDALSAGRIKCLTVVDDFTKEVVAILVERGISGVRVSRALDDMARFRGCSDAISTDQGPEFSGKALDQWASSATSS